VGYRPLYHTSVRTARVIAGLGVRWLALVGAQGLENSLTTGSPAVDESCRLRVEKRKRRRCGGTREGKMEYKRGRARKIWRRSTKATSGPTREDISSYLRRRSRFAKRGEHANQAERTPTRQQTACRRMTCGLRDSGNTTIANLLSNGSQNTIDYYHRIVAFYGINS